jgi:hypothetical protein
VNCGTGDSQVGAFAAIAGARVLAGWYPVCFAAPGTEDAILVSYIIHNFTKTAKKSHKKP